MTIKIIFLILLFFVTAFIPYSSTEAKMPVFPIYNEISGNLIQMVEGQSSDIPTQIPENLVHRYNESFLLNIPREIPKESIYFEKEKATAVDNIPKEIPKGNIFYKPGFAPLDDNAPREVPKELIHDITDSEREEVKKAIEESIQYTKSKKATNTKKVAPTQKVESQEIQKQNIQENQAKQTTNKLNWFQRLFNLFNK